jgi:hypothetical protein
LDFERVAHAGADFLRGRSLKSATPGVGLGLAICKAVIDAHRGRIRAANAPGGGAEFSFSLPRRPLPPHLLESMANPVALIVEDEPQIRRRAQRWRAKAGRCTRLPHSNAA